ncbi:hypothetical protein X943_003723 [Babesia divergens]|uniref:Uncharacterized protein n=1 Tax=Babesia divergens TaxID=32595 RepID=A0AAD9LL42_BABDI|nr:hypothetical protein X943_003723 [Babesia divergens]
MGLSEDNEDSWDSLNWLTEVAWFCCLNHKIIADWPAVYVISLYFVLSNLYDAYLSKIDEYAIVSGPVFASFFASSFSQMPLRGTTDSLQYQLDLNMHNVSFGSDSGLECLLKDDNHVLTSPQKALVRSMLDVECNAEVPGHLRFHLYVGCSEGRYHMVHCTCCAYDFADVSVRILENQIRYQKRPERMDTVLRRMPRVVERILQRIPPADFPAVEMIPHYLHVTYDWDSYVQFTNITICRQTPRLAYERILAASTVFLLYTLMPHAFAFRQLCGIIRRADYRELAELSFIIDRLLLNFPKEVDMWSMKLLLMKALFKQLPQKDPFLINNIMILLDRHCMDVGAFCLAVTEKGQMNGRIPWFLWNLYLSIRTLTLKNVRKMAQLRIRETLDSYFLQMYTKLLLANNGYQGIFYLYLHLVKKDPDGLNKLREMCELAEANASWKANIEILKNLPSV